MPGISPALQKELFLETVREKITEFYSYGEARPPARQKLSHELTGFFQAGILIKLVRVEEIQKMIDDEHHKAFGVSLEERKLQKKLGNEPEEQDWDLYDLPPKLRKKT